MLCEKNSKPVALEDKNIIKSKIKLNLKFEKIFIEYKLSQVIVLAPVNNHVSLGGSLSVSIIPSGTTCPRGQ